MENTKPWWHTWILIFFKFMFIHNRLTLQLSWCLKEASITEWMTKGKTTFIKEDSETGTIPRNYRLITCLPIMEYPNHTDERGDILLAFMPKSVSGKTEKIPQGNKRKQVTYCTLTSTFPRIAKRESVAMACINYKMAFDLVTWTWIIGLKIFNKSINFITEAMKNYKVELTAGERTLAEVKIQRGIF